MTRTFRLPLFLVLVMAALSPAAAQFASQGELPSLDDETRAAVVESLTAVIDSVYVLGEPARRIVEGLRANLADGLYDGIDDPADFAQRLEEDAQAIHHDGHFGIRAFPPAPPVPDEPREEDPADAERELRLDRASNYGFRRAEILPGGIGYLRFDRFSRGDEAFEAAAASMNFLANCNALILDLRHNGGGSASMIRFLAGYLFAEETHLINWEIRAEGLTKQSYSADYVPGRRLLEQPVYVLTSQGTFSAAEEFTFDMKNLGRATVVGETTGGGGHTVSSHTFDFDGFRMGVRVPYGRAFNPENDEGWEGVGVTPHIEVPEGEALDAAQVHALETLVASEEDEIVRGLYRFALDGVRVRLEPVSLAAEDLEDCPGSYGPRLVYAEDGQLFYRRGQQPAHRLVPMGDGLFGLEGLDYFRLRFERDGKGRVIRVHGLYDNGQSNFNDRDGD